LDLEPHAVLRHEIVAAREGGDGGERDGNREGERDDSAHESLRFRFGRPSPQKDLTTPPPIAPAAGTPPWPPRDPPRRRGPNTGNRRRAPADRRTGRARAGAPHRRPCA